MEVAAAQAMYLSMYFRKTSCRSMVANNLYVGSLYPSSMTRFTWPEFGYPKPLLGDFAAKMQDRALLPVRGTVRGRQNAAKFYFR
jgi:hypothetical protein